MKVNSQNPNIKFLNEMKNLISEIEKNKNELKIYLNNIIESEDTKKYEDEFKKEIENLSDCINTKKDIKEKQKFLGYLKKAYKNYNENKLLVYENTFIKKIKENTQKLQDLMNKIIIEFDPPKENYLCNDINIDVRKLENSNEGNYNYYGQQDNRKTCFEGYSSFDQNNNSESIKNEDNGHKKEIDYFCSVCSKKEAIYLCDNCNQLFCQECFETIKKFDNTNNKCEHNTQKISDVKSQNEKGKILYLNSLKNYIKSIMIKSNYLFNSEIIKYKSMNDSKIEYIKKIYFKYPFLEKINDFNSEINFLIDINNILENNFNIGNLDSKSFCISDMDKTLLDSILSIFKDDPNNYKYIRENVREISEDEDDSNQDIENEIYIEEEEINSIINKFYYFINLIPKKRIKYNKKNIKSLLFEEIANKYKIKKSNIYLLFDGKNAFINYFIKTEKFSSMSLQKIKKIFLNVNKKIYEYKKIYENLSLLIDKKYLDYKGNTICPNSSNNLFRGTEKYNPPYGWIGIGLKVLNIYEDNNWLEDKTKYSKWAIAYHGVGHTLYSNEIKEVLKNIITKNGLIEGDNKQKFNSKDIRHPGEIIGEGIYLTPYIDIAENFAGTISICNKIYKVILMAKVLISEIKEPNDINYWILNKNYVRIYRILLKEI